jgi:DNA ligase-1
MKLAELAAATAAVGSTRSRLAKTAALAEVLRRAPDDELAIVVAYLTGNLPQRQIGAGWASLRDLPPPVPFPTLEVAEVDRALAAIGQLAGPGSQQARRAALDALLGAATVDEQQFLRLLMLGELRQGAQVGVMTDAVASAFGVPLADVRRAAMLRGELPAIAVAARAGGQAALGEFRLQVGRPIAPMLAQTAEDPAEALGKLGEAAFDRKLDGARIQVHKDGAEIAVFTRTLDDITARSPEVVAAAALLPARAIVLDGEALAVRADGRPHAFQVTAGRFGARRDVEQASAAIPLQPFYFDILHLDGEDLLDRPARDRLAALAEAVPPAQQIERLVTADAQQANEFLRATLAAGHEGVVAKSLDAPYEAGRRGGAWLKIKPVHTLDLVVLAVEWGSGRRRGWLSNLHLGARDPEAGGFVMLGKTFKGMTDELLRWQTEALLARAIGPTDGYVVTVRPELVVEIAFDGVQRSTRYPGGVTLRFARVVRYRDDKTADEADTIDTVRAFRPA